VTGYFRKEEMSRSELRGGGELCSVCVCVGGNTKRFLSAECDRVWFRLTIHIFLLLDAGGTATGRRVRGCPPRDSSRYCPRDPGVSAMCTAQALVEDCLPQHPRFQCCRGQGRPALETAAVVQPDLLILCLRGHSLPD
jgi:hypothetical protein